jgi:hypothetical protein
VKKASAITSTRDDDDSSVSSGAARISSDCWNARCEDWDYAPAMRKKCTKTIGRLANELLYHEKEKLDEDLRLNNFTMNEERVQEVRTPLHVKENVM